MAFIDVHTHMMTLGWIDLLKAHGAPRYGVGEVAGGHQAVHMDGAPFMTLMPEMWDYDARIRNMDAAGVDMAVVSLTCPNSFFGPPEVSLQAARIVNDDMAAAQARFPDRIRWFASLPWQYSDLATEELERALGNGAAGVMCLANIDQKSLTAPEFAPIWRAIDRKGLPVLVHPTAPPGVAVMDVARYNLVASVGFMFDTTLAIARMIYDGFLDRYQDLKIIAAHGGAALPYLAGRLDFCHLKMPPARERISAPPTDYLRRIWYDSVLFRDDALKLCLDIAGEDRVLYGSDYPHNIGDMKGCRERVERLGPDLARRIGETNTRGIFAI